MAKATVESISRLGSQFRCVTSDGIIYFDNTSQMREFIGRTKENQPLREAFADILERDATLSSPEDVRRWEYTTQKAVRVVR